MDLLTPAGFIVGGLVIYWGMQTGGAAVSFGSLHGIGIVMGGTLGALLIHCSVRELAAAARSFFALFMAPRTPDSEALVTFLTQLCREARRGGLKAIQDAGSQFEDDGFLARALDVALGSGDARSAQEALEREINNVRSRHREVAAIFRTTATLAPMYGLMGTLIGIVGVLGDLKDPAAIGSSMSVALASAFYGITLSNLVCLPVAGKLRSRSLLELTAKELVMVGVLDIVYTQKAPTVVELGLRSFLQGGRRDAAGAV